MDRLHAATARYQLAEAIEDERFRTQLALALYRVGRRAEALEVCRYTRRLLVDELGVEPGPALAELEQAILHQDPELTVPAAAAAPRQRARVTVDSAEEMIHGVRLGLRCVIEIDGVAKPAWRASFRFFGTTPVAEVLAWLDENEPREGRNHWLRAGRAGVLAMTGRSDEAQAIVAETCAELAERGSDFKRASLHVELAEVHVWLGDHTAAAEFGAEACRLFDEQGELSMLSTSAGVLARALYALGRVDEADVWAHRARELGASDDVWTQILWRQVTALLLARRGRHAEAVSLAREALALCEGTELLDAQGDAHADLAEVYLLGGKPDAAVAELEQALERYERKGNLVSAGRARTRLAVLRDAAP